MDRYGHDFGHERTRARDFLDYGHGPGQIHDFGVR